MSSVKRKTVVTMMVATGLLVGTFGSFSHEASAADPGFSASSTDIQAEMRELSLVSSVPELPASAATADPASFAAGEALWALWFDDESYEAKLDALVPMIAFRALVPPDQLAATWKNTERRRMIVVLSALTQLGVKYRHNASKQGIAFDCSGLTGWAWSQVGVSLPRNSLSQMRATTLKDRADTLPGDLVYYPGHIMIALGVGNAIIHSPNTGSRVEVRPMMKARVNRYKVASPLG